MKIQPFELWKDGELKTANNITVIISNDNCNNSATICYKLEEEVITEDITLSPIDPRYLNILSSSLDIDGSDYTSWTSTPDTNTWIYNWVVNKLHLTPA